MAPQETTPAGQQLPQYPEAVKRKLDLDDNAQDGVPPTKQPRRGGPRARNFTTYLTGTKDELSNKIQQYADKVDWYAGQDELGREGMNHIQLTFGFTNPRALNALQQSLPNGENIQIARDTLSAIKYSTDETKRVANVYLYGDVPNFNHKQNTWTNELYATALAKGSFAEAMKYVEETDLTTYIMNHKKIFAYFENKFAQGDESRFSPDDFNIPLFPISKTKTLVLVGPTGFGKTQFALAHFKHPLRVTNKQDWARFREGITDGIVLDDMHFNTWLPNTILHTVDVENAVTQDIKYSSVRIPAGTPRIICINSDKELYPEGIAPEKKAAIARRLEYHQIYEPLFSTEQT